jgi:hypothetical protein
MTEIEKELSDLKGRVVALERREGQRIFDTETFRTKLVESDLANTARIAAIERFARELAIKSLGDTPDTASFCKLIDKYFHQKLAEIKSFKGA